MSAWDDFFQNGNGKIPRVKICGISNADDALAIVSLGTGAIGVNFWEESKRYITPADAQKWLPELAGKTLRVGVFVNPSDELLEQTISMIDVVQLHGDESPERVHAVKKLGLPVIKAIGIAEESDLENLSQYLHADALLLDTASSEYGGTGKTFDWSLAKKSQEKYPHVLILLAGGITPENAAQALAISHANALDVASGSEETPRKKDLEKVKKLLEASKSLGC